MQKRVVPPVFSIGLISVVYFGICFFVTGCASVNESFVKTVQIHVQAIGADYEKHLKAPDNPIFVEYIPVLEQPGTYQRKELFPKEERAKLEASRMRSVEELNRVINEQLTKGAEAK